MEFPVAVQDAVTHIDLVLRAGESHTYLVGECKRVDPALGRWCFARTPLRGAESRLNRLTLERLIFSQLQKLRSDPLVRAAPSEPYTIGVEIRTKESGDGMGGVKDAIDRSIAQVLRGASGLANHYYSLDWSSLTGQSFIFVPVVFTTAELWVTDAYIGNSSLESGNVPEDKFRAEPTGWLWFNYNISPNLQHSIPQSDALRNLAEVLTAESTRSVAIVNPRGLDQFLDIDMPDQL